MVQRNSSFEIAVMMTSKFPMYAYHPLQAADRLCNPKINFPIGIVFGDKDYLGSEGADQIIRQNKHFEKLGKKKNSKLNNHGILSKKFLINYG